ncbi:hypothetical protein GWO13_06155 [Candidatus Bathyarchaeota archaeon]|nr:hypothetical protein [Candidatus Bathyarchaeota archaeon]
MLDGYYRLRGWDKEGCPTKELKEFNLIGNVNVKQ